MGWEVLPKDAYRELLFVPHATYTCIAGRRYLFVRAHSQLVRSYVYSTTEKRNKPLPSNQASCQSEQEPIFLKEIESLLVRMTPEARTRLAHLLLHQQDTTVREEEQEMQRLPLLAARNDDANQQAVQQQTAQWSYHLREFL
jgi:hypothetical protein